MLAPAEAQSQGFPEPFGSALLSMMRSIAMSEPDLRFKVFRNQYTEAITWPGEQVDYYELRERFIDQAQSTGLVERYGIGNIYDTIARAETELVTLLPTGAESIVRATPYQWQDPAAIPRRDWLYGHLLIRKFVSATVAPGGVGKSSLIATEALAMVSGKDLIGVDPRRRLRVWLWNLEDPQEETTRKLQAAAKHYGLASADLGGLYVDSGRDQKLVIATQSRSGAVIAQPVVDALVGQIEDNEIDVLIVDPFVSSHGVSENDNQAMDLIVKEWGRVAERANCAIHLIHHTRKMTGGVETEVTTESSRGGKALTDGCRVVRAVNRMSKDEGDKAGVENHRLYFRTLNDKANLQPPADQSDWFKLESVDLGNGPMAGTGGDSVGVVTPWQWPDPLADVTGADFDKAARAIRGGKWRENVQAKDWVGRAIGEALGLNLDCKADKSKVVGILKAWLASGSLIVVEGKDEKRETKKFVEVREDE